MPATVQKDSRGCLIVRFPYSKENVEKIRQIDGRKWHPIEKFWTIPADKNSESKIHSLFSIAQVIYITSEGEIRGNISTGMHRSLQQVWRKISNGIGYKLVAQIVE